MKKPKLFVGSSVENINYANAIQSNLEYDADVTVWNQGVFKPSSNALVDLANIVKEVDFAVFVFNPDDITLLRKEEFHAVRDNVIFEFGLFIGGIGIQRVFYLIPRDCADLHLPTDILGLNPVKYDGNRLDNLRAALGSACSEIREVIKVKGAIFR